MISWIRTLQLFLRKPLPRGNGNTVLMLLDFENLYFNTEFSLLPERIRAIEEGLTEVIRNITHDIGKIYTVLVFLPPHQVLWAQKFEEMGFFTILCPQEKDKTGEMRDRTDLIMIRFGKLWMDLPGLTHLCIGSGDKDFAPLVFEAHRKGLQIVIVAGDKTSLSDRLAQLADVNLHTGKKMIYIFSLTKRPR